MEISADLLTASKAFKVEMHLGVYEPICFKLETVIGTITLLFDASLLQNHRDARDFKLMCQF